MAQKKERIKLSDHFTYRTLIWFTLPTMGMMIMGSVYWCFDGLFISRFAGSTALAAANLIMPIVMIMGSVGFMLGVGGAALVGKVLGEGKRQEANDLFSLITAACFVTGLILSVIGFLLMPKMAESLGAAGELEDLAVMYGRISLISMPAFVLKYQFQTFFITAEKPRLGFLMTVISGAIHISLDALFIGGLGWGLAGAGFALNISEFAAAIGAVVYFFRENDSLLRLGKIRWNGPAILKSSTNGASEFLANISFSAVGVAFNYELMRFAGENGVAAYGVVMYFSGIFTSIFWGYGVGVSPIFSFQYGAQNKAELKSLLVKSLKIEFLFGIVMAVLGVLLAKPLCTVYVGYQEELLTMTIYGFKVYSVSYILMGFGYFGSVFFTALNNGLISGTIATLRVLVFQVGRVIVMANLFGLSGIWYSYIVAQTLGAATSFFFILANRKRYGYL